MEQKVYQLKFDKQYDADIDKWLSNLPRSKKAEHVKHAIRFYMAYAGDSKFPVMPGFVRVGAGESAVAIENAQSNDPAVEEEPKRELPTWLGTDGV